jgi:hypothetical protein
MHDIIINAERHAEGRRVIAYGSPAELLETASVGLLMGPVLTIFMDAVNMFFPEKS